MKKNLMHEKLQHVAIQPWFPFGTIFRLIDPCGQTLYPSD